MTVTIGSDTFDVYGSSAGLATYANGSWLWSATYTAAVAVSANGPLRALVEATRLLNRQAWDGDLTSSSQALAWPRDGVTATPASGIAVTDGVTPDEIVQGAYELTLAMLAKPSVVASTNTSSNIASVGAGAASVSFFSPVAGGRFPDRVMELLSWAFGADDSVLLAGGAYATGTDGCSQFDAADTYSRTGPG